MEPISRSDVMAGRVPAIHVVGEGNAVDGDATRRSFTDGGAPEGGLGGIRNLTKCVFVKCQVFPANPLKSLKTAKEMFGKT